MILAINVGNTNVTVGCIDRKQTYFIERISTQLNKTELEYAISLKNIMELYHISPSRIEGGIVSSVVPPLSETIRQSAIKIIQKDVRLVGPGVKNGLNIQIDNPAQLGSNMVVNAVGAMESYPLPIIIIDMGTATSISVINQKGCYAGGVIIPGLNSALDYLAIRTSQLPKISLEAPEHAIGKNTVACMQSGAVYGTASMLDGMIERMEEELGSPATVVSTGKIARFISPYCRHKILYDDTLMLKGLLSIYEKNSGRCSHSEKSAAQKGEGK